MKLLLVLLLSLMSVAPHLSSAQKRYQIILEPPVANGNKYTCKSIETIIEFHSSLYWAEDKPFPFRLSMHSYNNSISTTTLYLDFRPVYVTHRLILHYDVQYNEYGKNATEEKERTTNIEPGLTKQIIHGYSPFQGDGEAYAYEADIQMTIREFSIDYSKTENFKGDHMCEGGIILNFEFPIQESDILYIKPENGSYSEFKTIDQYQTGVYLSSVEVANRIGYRNNYTLKLNSATCEMPPIYPNYPIKDANPSVVDNILQVNLSDKDYLAQYSFFKEEGNTNEVKNGSKIADGSVRLTFYRDKHCPVERYAYIPQIDYNLIGAEGNKKNFWYEGEQRDALNLNFMFPSTDYQATIPYNIDLLKGEWVYEDAHVDYNNFSSQSSSATLSLYNGDTEYISCWTISYPINTKKDLTTITLKPKNNSFISVTKTVDKLTAYTKITEPKVEITNATCYYHNAEINVSDIEEGLQNDYKFMLTNGDKSFWYDDNPIKIAPSKFGGGQQTVDLYVYDKNKTDDDTGYEERRFGPMSISFSYGDELLINDYKKTDILCNGDKTGSIDITDWEPKKDGIKFKLYKIDESEQYIYDYPFPKLLAGDYQLKILDANECENSNYYVTLNQPKQPLTIAIDSKTDALCYKYSDGSIFTSVAGGTPGYKYSWNVGAISKDLLNVPAGKYQLIVRDAHKCEASTDLIEVKQPDELINTLTPSYTLCQGSELRIDDGNHDPKQFTHGYEWHLPDSTIQQGRLLTVSTDMLQGKYVLKSKNEDCFTLDTTLITFADNNLPIRFLVPTESFFDDTLVIAEDSEIDDDYTWRYAFNTEMFSDITTYVNEKAELSSNLTFLRINKSGNDTITMYADNGFCKASLSKEVTVSPHFRPEDYDYTVDAAGIFSRLQIGPNPNNGEFTLFANLTEDSPLTISLYDVMRSRKIPIDFSKYKTPASHYQIPFQGLGLRSGAYTLLVSANGETKQIKFVVE